MLKLLLTKGVDALALAPALGLNLVGIMVLPLLKLLLPRDLLRIECGIIFVNSSCVDDKSTGSSSLRKSLCA